MRFVPLLALALSLLSAPALAEDQPIGTGTGSGAASAEAAVEKTGGSDSESNRGGKIAYVGIENGLGLLIPAQGVEAGYMGLGPSLTVGLNYLATTLESEGFEASASLVMVKAMWYPGNSFYLSGGLGQRSYKFDFSLDASAAGAGDIKVSAAATSIGLDFGIGNRWQWSGFWLGVEWLGYFLPTAKSGDNEVKVPAGADDKSGKDAKDSFDKLAKTGTPQLLRLALGWAF